MQGPTIPDLIKKVEFGVESMHHFKKSRGENDVRSSTLNGV